MKKMEYIADNAVEMLWINLMKCLKTYGAFPESDKNTLHGFFKHVYV
jgi:hypothetical protein